MTIEPDAVLTDLDAAEEQLRWNLRNGLDNVAGSTGDDPATRKDALEAARKTAIRLAGVYVRRKESERLQVVQHVDPLSIDEVDDVGRRADALTAFLRDNDDRDA